MKHFLRRFLPLLALFIGIELAKQIPSWSNYYAIHLYPTIRTILDGLLAWLPFSLYDLLIVGAIIALLTGIVGLFLKRYRRRAAEWILLGLGWTYVAFYALWGINYFVPDFYTRNGLTPHTFNEAEFHTFLSNYVDSLNTAYATVGAIQRNVKRQFTASQQQFPTTEQVSLDSLIHTESIRADLSDRFPVLPSQARVKSMLFGELYAKMGVRGYFGPFTGEAHVSPLLLSWERPFVTAHELGHKAGIAHEAEANLYAYLLTTGSDDAFTRFSGYYSLLSYVASNARTVLSVDDYRAFLDSMDSRILDLAEQSHTHWLDHYSATLGAIQDWLYEFYLRNNNIPSGQKNYSEVVGMVIALQER